MSSTAPNITPHRINEYVSVLHKDAAGKKLSGKDKSTLGELRDLYSQVDSLELAPELKTALRTALEVDAAFTRNLKDNSVLAQHMRGLLKKGSASVDDIEAIAPKAGKLSYEEETAVTGALSILALRGGLSSEAIDKAEQYLGAERTSRARSIRNQNLKGTAIGVGAGLLLAIAAPIFFWSGAGPAVAAEMGIEGAKMLQMSASALGAFSGLGTAVKMGLGAHKKSGQYGVKD
jgi:hypothetical protein